MSIKIKVSKLRAFRAWKWEEQDGFGQLWVDSGDVSYSTEAAAKPIG